MANIPKQLVEELSPEVSNVFESILKATAAKIGTDFFKAIVEQLSRSLDCWGAWVTELDAENGILTPVAFWAHGQHIDHAPYRANGTPCQDVIEDVRLHYVPDHAVDRYPDDEGMKDVGVCSYIGMPLMDPFDQILGHIAIMDTKPILDPDKVSIFELFGERATAEMRRICGQRLIRQQEEQLRLLFESALDGILVLDDELRVKSLNPSALKAFGCDEEEDIVGERVTEFLDGTSQSRVEALAAELVRADSDNRCIWIPENLTVRRWDNTTFPAEASLSCFEFGSQCRYCLILRDIGDVIASENHIKELQRENRQLRESAKNLSGEVTIIGQCPSMKQLERDMGRVGDTDASVLIVGETGVGKELIARAIHALGSRSSSPMVCLNCAALPENLVESELFGHKKGAFTGATAEREGRFALANGGTLMLDEIGELPLNAQAKLLRTLQEGIYEPLGGDGPINTDVRIIAATHRDLAEMVAEGRFREDLFFRLNVFPLVIPPLRDRGDDILLLANEFLRKLARQLGRRVHEFGPSDLAILKAYDWPGNVRELQNTVERALIISSTSKIDLAAAMALGTDGYAPAPSGDPEYVILTEVEMRNLESSNITRALKKSGCRISGAGGAASLLGMKPTTLNSRIKALRITVPV